MLIEALLDMLERRIAIMLVPAAFLLAASSAFGQEAPVAPTRPDDPTVRIARGLPTWTDNAKHYQLVLSYDGKRIKLLSGLVAEGSARSYLSQRPDIVVTVRRKDGGVMRQFNLPDPLELRVWDVPANARAAFRERPKRSVGKLHEHTLRLKSARFELVLPQIPGATRVEFRKGSEKGPLLGVVKLSTLR